VRDTVKPKIVDTPNLTSIATNGTNKGLEQREFDLHAVDMHPLDLFEKRPHRLRRHLGKVVWGLREPRGLMYLKPKIAEGCYPIKNRVPVGYGGGPLIPCKALWCRSNAHWVEGDYLGFGDVHLDCKRGTKGSQSIAKVLQLRGRHGHESHIIRVQKLSEVMVPDDNNFNIWTSRCQELAELLDENSEKYWTKGAALLNPCNCDDIPLANPTVNPYLEPSITLEGLNGM
jgi:hypothetical protein